MDETGGAFNMHGRGEKHKKIFVRKPGGKRSLQMAWHRWGNNIKIVLKHLGHGGQNSSV